VVWHSCLTRSDPGSIPGEDKKTKKNKNKKKTRRDTGSIAGAGDSPLVASALLSQI
jgi:hypothetical protein